MKRFVSMALALMLVLGLMTACASQGGDQGKTTPAATGSGQSGETNNASQEKDDGKTTTGKKVYNVVHLVNGNLGDRSFFDSADAGLKKMAKSGRIKYRCIEMGGRDEDQPRWRSTLEDVSKDHQYDFIICGTYQMPKYVEEVAKLHPDQKYIVYDSEAKGKNVVNLNYKQNDMGYLIGIIAASMTTETAIDKINPEKVIGFVGGVDSPVINDFLYGYLLGAKSVDPAIKVDTRYVNSYVDPGKAKEFASSMIKDNHVDIIWGVAGNSGNGAAEEALESKKAWFIGVDSDQELTFSKDLAAITLTSGLKNIGKSLIWYLDQYDAGIDHMGTTIWLGLSEDGVGIVTDKNYARLVPETVKDRVEKAREKIASGALKVPTAIGNTSNDLAKLRDEMQPKP